MIHEKLVKKTTTLKTLDRVEGSEGHKDYFVIFEDRVRYCLKLDFSVNHMGQPIGFFVRIRLVPDAKIDLYSMSNWFNQHFKAADVNKKLHTNPIKGGHLTVGSNRISFVLTSDKTLDGYGDPTTQEGYEKLYKELSKDFTSLGKRILRSMAIFCEPTDAVKKVVAESMADFLTMYAPAKPDAKKPKGKKADVIAIDKVLGKANGAAKKILEKSGVVPKIDDIVFVDEETGVATSVKGTELGDAALEILNEVVEPPKKDKPKKK